MAAEWYCRIAGAEIGPLSPEQLRALAAEGRLRADDTVCRGKGGPWVPVGRVRGLLKGPAAGGSQVSPTRQDGPSSRPTGTRPANVDVPGPPRQARIVPGPPEPPPVPASGVVSLPAATPQFAFPVRAVGAGPPQTPPSRPASLSAADLANVRKKQRVTLLVRSLVALGGAAVVGGLLLIVDPFRRDWWDNSPPQQTSPDERFQEGDLTGGVSDRLSADADRWLDAPIAPPETELAPRRPRPTEKAVRQAIGMDDEPSSDRPLESFEKLRRDNPELFPDES